MKRNITRVIAITFFAAIALFVGIKVDAKYKKLPQTRFDSVRDLSNYAGYFTTEYEAQNSANQLAVMMRLLGFQNVTTHIAVSGAPGRMNPTRWVYAVCWDNVIE